MNVRECASENCEALISGESDFCTGCRRAEPAVCTFCGITFTEGGGQYCGKMCRQQATELKRRDTELDAERRVVLLT